MTSPAIGGVHGLLSERAQKITHWFPSLFECLMKLNVDEDTRDKPRPAGIKGPL